MTDHPYESLPVDAFGCSLMIELPQSLLPLLLEALPPGYRLGRAGSVAQRAWAVASAPDGSLQAFADGGLLVTHPDVATVLRVVLSDVELWVAEHSPLRVFVHAGCVGFNGRAIVIPGRTMTGKSTLVAALTAAGATYLSDEYALLDDQGYVWPYARPLSLRSTGPLRPETAKVLGRLVEPFDGRLPVGAVCAIPYDAEAGWNVHEMGQGEAVLSLVDNSVPARTRPDAVLTSLVAATRAAVAIEGTRGEAEAAACRLLERVGEPMGTTAPVSGVL